MKEKRGQALIVLAFALIALAAFAGLAIDGGRTYTARRQTQNTADAVALAGTRLLAQYIGTCGSIGPIDADRAVTLEMINIARSNGVDPLGDDATLEAWYVDADENELGPVGWAGVMPGPGGGALASPVEVVVIPGIPDGAAGIRALLTVTDNTTFLKIVGQDEIEVTGEAMAMSGPVLQLTGGGILPLGVWHGIVDALDEGDEFILFDEETYCRGEPCDFSGHHIPNSLHGWLNMRYLYNVDTWHTNLDRTFVKTVGNNNCSYNPDGTVNVPGTGLKGWASGPACPYPFPIFAGAPGALNGDYIHAVPGMRASSLMELRDNHPLGTLVYAPIFDYVYVTGDMEANFGHRTPDIGWVTAGGGVNASYLHIIGFVGTRLSSIQPTGGNKHIAGAFEHAIIGDGVISPSSGFNAGDGICADMRLMGVQLWR